ncbi:MAG TPA: YndJ family transporter [Candidatus Acidoferrum sp.]|nr:YndJ family transporter [Candidatus Acidoferrum sp.]
MRPDDPFWRRLPVAAVAGGVVWLVLVETRLTGVIQLTLIDLLFILAPLVIAPLGLQLISVDEGLALHLLRAAVRIQPIGALLAAAAFLLPIGVWAAILASGWLLVCIAAAFGALAYLIQGRSLHPVRIATAAAVAFMAFGAIWLVLSRAGIAPIGLSPIIVEMTAVHFHFTGFAATLMAALLLGRLRQDRGIARSVAIAAALLLVAGSPVLALGWATPVRVLQVAGAVLVATGVVAASTVMFFRAPRLVQSTGARVLLRLSALAPLLPMVLAVEYSAGHVFGFPTLDIQGMALIHGDLNALGFSLLGLLAWSIGGSADDETGAQRLALRFRST